ncbi:hypothetical protein [uncultured Methanobrevibacter sp.]|uniref:hypothetical protein n=1 Tax=uncultured Methanobrevibacter sp. TaxID=253161 RepID=UPI0025CDFB1B|nr:hypothetical protein [uncultured Methanobrevibacter sp.]
MINSEDSFEILNQNTLLTSLDSQTFITTNFIPLNYDDNLYSDMLTNYKDVLSNHIVIIKFVNPNPINYDSKDSEQIPITDLYTNTSSIGAVQLGSKSYTKSNSKDIIILEPIDIFIESNDLTLKYGCDDYFEAMLTDNEDNLIQDQTVLFGIGQKTYAAKTDNNGIARLQINLKPGKYTISTSFKGTDFYNEANAVNTITIADSGESEDLSGVGRSISKCTIQDSTISQKTDTKNTSIKNSVKTFSLNQIIQSSKSLKTYYAISGRLPETVKIASVEVNLSEFLYYESIAILNIENDYKFAIKRIDSIDEASLIDARLLNNKLYKIRYLDSAKEISNYILENHCGAENIITSIGEIPNTQLIEAFAGILDYYSKNNYLPEFVTMSGENPASLPNTKESSNSLDDAPKEDIQISACNVKMQSGENKYFEVKLNDGYGNPLKNEKISLALKRFKLEYDLQKRDWAYKYANTTEFTVKTNKNGIGLLKLNLKTGYYKVNASFNKDGIFKSCCNDINVNSFNSENFDGDSTQKIFSV